MQNIEFEYNSYRSYSKKRNANVRVLQCYGKPSERQIKEIRKLDYEQLSLINSQWNDFGLISNLPIRRLQIDGRTLIDNWESISFLDHLEELRFSYNSNSKILDLSSLERLETLSCADAPSLKLPKNIRKLNLVAIKSGIEDHFLSLPKLKYLRIANAQRKCSLKGIESAHQLLKVNLSIIPKLTDIEPILKLKSLKSFHLENCKNINDAEKLGILDGLVELVLGNTGPLRTLKFLEKFTIMESFTLNRDAPVLDNDLSPILRMPCLKICHVKNKKNYNIKNIEIINHLKALGRYTKYNELKQNWDWNEPLF